MATAASKGTNQKTSTRASGSSATSNRRHSDALGELLGRLATVSTRHLREVSALPTDVVSHFNSELAKPTKPRPKRRAARRQAAT